MPKNESSESDTVWPHRQGRILTVLGDPVKLVRNTASTVVTTLVSLQTRRLETCRTPTIAIVKGVFSKKCVRKSHDSSFKKYRNESLPQNE